MADWTPLSKLVSYALRHRPLELELGLELDADGWVPVAQLVEALRGQPGWETLQIAELEAMVAGATRQRHELRDGRIRAHYGHSVAGRIEHEPELGPATLFHGTARRAVASILRDGLLPRERQYVHLARTAELAAEIGRRRDGEPCVLEIDVAAATLAGIGFHSAGDEIVLCEHVPASFVRIWSDTGDRRDERGPEAKYACPVCDYAGLDVKPYETWPPPPQLELRPPYEDLLGRPSYEVCPRCGFEFGNDDNPGTAEPESFEQYRREWEARGRPWFEPPNEIDPPEDRD